MPGELSPPGGNAELHYRRCRSLGFSFAFDPRMPSSERQLVFFLRGGGKLGGGNLLALRPVNEISRL